MVKSTLRSLAAMLTCDSSLRAESSRLGLVAMLYSESAGKSELSPPGPLGIPAKVATWLLELETAFMLDMLI